MVDSSETTSNQLFCLNFPALAIYFIDKLIIYLHTSLQVDAIKELRTEKIIETIERGQLRWVGHLVHTYEW